MAEYVELDIDQGSDFNADLDITNDDMTNIDVTGFTYASSIRKSYYSLRPAANFVVQTVDPENGFISLYLSAAVTSNIKPGRYVFDVKQTDTSSVTTRLFEGIITVNPQVTK